MRALVTGGAGFIGSHLTELLLNQGVAVTVVDNLATGRRENLATVADHPGLDFVQADVSDSATIAPLFAGVDWVFHLAALADIVPSIERPLEYYRANVEGTVTVLEAARQAGVKRFIYAASSSAYGIPDHYPTPETAPPRPQYPYALTKHLGEELTLHWGQVYHLPVLALRLFNVFGPRARSAGSYGAVFGVFLAQKLADKPFTVVGDGSQTRDFTFVTDVARAFLLAARSTASGLALNVGSGGTYSINHLCQLLEGEVVHLPKRPGEPDCTFADTARIRELLGWQPQVSFAEGVKTMVQQIAHWQTAPVWTPETIAAATTTWFKFLK